jgi:hypothetical protein
VNIVLRTHNSDTTFGILLARPVRSFATNSPQRVTSFKHASLPTTSCANEARDSFTMQLVVLPVTQARSVCTFLAAPDAAGYAKAVLGFGLLLPPSEQAYCLSSFQQPRFSRYSKPTAGGTLPACLQTLLATLYPRGKNPRYPLYRRLGWLQRRLSAEGREKKKPPPLSRIEPG